MKSHRIDKPTYCLLLRPQSRHSDLWYFGAQLLSLQPCCLRLAHYITVTHSRLASNAVVSSLFDGASTHRTIYPLLDARSDLSTHMNKRHLSTLLYFPFLEDVHTTMSYVLISPPPFYQTAPFPCSNRKYVIYSESVI